ncbi:hypothetical protein NPIL_340461 [Nephila pilipes]|uniref:Uncharacterized protein n=1 Tax=Nephila pilipes TaxID=299642 RepID=A0A8X6NK10_NEPPI|nr:hypothetical protein NPIL_340461 [Nephila pilipes]
MPYCSERRCHVRKLGASEGFFQQRKLVKSQGLMEGECGDYIPVRLSVSLIDALIQARAHVSSIVTTSCRNASPSLRCLSKRKPASAYWCHFYTSSIDGLWKGDHSQCRFQVEEWMVDFCATNPQSHCNTNGTLGPSVQPSSTVTQYRHRSSVIRSNIQIHFWQTSILIYDC